ncbi:Putative nuclease HARBI1, partial [Cyphomyrmex costatus]
RFWTRTQFPGVIGAIDGTHIAIVPPNAEREHLYINRKLYHSLNVLIVSDYEGTIFIVNAAYGGRTHDARIWRASRVSNHLQEMYAAGRKDAWLLGNSTFKYSFVCFNCGNNLFLYTYLLFLFA